MLTIPCSIQIESQLVDRIAARINEEVITLSDVIGHLKDQGRPVPDEPAARDELFRAVLDELIDRRLIVAAAFDTPFFEVTDADVNQFVEQRREVQGQELFERRLLEGGLTEAQYREYARELLAVNRFVAIRFEPFVIVLPEEIAQRHTSLYGTSPFPTRAETEEVLRQQIGIDKVQQQLERWVRGQRRKSDVEILLFRQADKGNRPF